MIVHNNIEKRKWTYGQNRTTTSRKYDSTTGKYYLKTEEVVTSVESVAQNYRKKYVDSVVTTDYRLRVLSGQPLPYNNYTHETYQFGPWSGWYRAVSEKLVPGQEGYVETYQNGDFAVVTTNLPNIRAPGVRVFSPTEVSQLSRLCDAKLLSKIKDQKINAAVAMAEAYKTMDMVAENAIRLANALRHLRKGNLAAAANALGVKAGRRSKSRFQRNFPRDQNKATARGWLELQYGWKPLLNDIYGGAEHLAQNPPPNWLDVHTSQTLEYTDRERELHVSSSTRFVEIESAQLIVRKGVRFKVHSIESKTMAQLGFTSPAVVAWELVPFSFVIDWTLPIGNWLAQYDATSGLIFLDAYRTTVQNFWGTTTEYKDAIQPPYKIEGVKVQNYEGYRMTRAKLSAFPVPTFPSFRNPLSPTRLANALALLQSLRK